MTKLIVNTDGAARGNPGPAASSFIIRDSEGAILSQDGVCLGETTNNVAEYSAVKFALNRIVLEFSGILPADVEVKSDSKLIVEQLSGNFKIKNMTLRALFNEIKLLEGKIGSVNYIHIPREQNYQADLLANKALDDDSF